jgi:hypothetical protein
MKQRWLVYSGSGEVLSDTASVFNWAVAAYAHAALVSESWDGFVIVKWEGDGDPESRCDIAAFVHGNLIWEDTGRM